MTYRIYTAIGFHPCDAMELPWGIASSRGPVTDNPSLLSPDAHFDPGMKGVSEPCWIACSRA
jgi:hypothetical protein